MADYLRTPVLSKEHLAFVSRDALWIAPRGGGPAERLTAGEEEVLQPRFSPDGRWLAYASDAEGTAQVFVLPAGGGIPRQLSWEAEACVPVAFRPGGGLVFRTTARGHVPRCEGLFEVHLEGGAPRRLPVGRAREIDFLDAEGDRVVLGLNASDAALWKRYRGGQAGDLWIGSLSRGELRRLIQMEGGPVQPVFAAGRVWFVSDRDGCGNVWSCTPEGEDLRQHTRGREHYVRSLRACGDELVLGRGAEIFVLDAHTGEERRLEVELRQVAVGLRRSFVTAAESLADYELSADGKALALCVRGKAVSMEPWGAAVSGHGRRFGVRYRLPRWLGCELLLVSDEGGEEAVEIHRPGAIEAAQRVELSGVRRIVDLVPCPVGRSFALSDVAGRLLLVDADSSDAPRLLARGEYGPVRDASWSHDGRWLAFVQWVGGEAQGGRLQLYDARTGELAELNDGELPVRSPSFDPDGRFLYVLSERTFNPVVDSIQLGAVCPDATRLYAFVLRRDGLSPFDPRWPERLEREEKEREKKLEGADEEAKKRPRPVEIDLAGLAERLVVFPDVAAGRYSKLRACSGGVLFLDWPRAGLLDLAAEERGGKGPLPRLEHLELSSGKRTEICAEVSDYQLRGEKTLIRTRDGLRILKTGEEPPEEPGREGKNPQTGWVDLERARVEIRPQAEWRQMYLEAWRLQRDRFWRRDMGGVDWEAMRDRYLPLLERVATRSELSDVIWELQGELSTSHAYEIGGDWPATSDWPVGLLGAELSWDGEGYRVDRVLEGDAWRRDAASPLARPGSRVEEGERILAIGGRPLDERHPPGSRMVDQAGRWVELEVVGPEGGERRRVPVRSLATETPLRYRDWVKRNRARTLESSEGRLGYLHVPDMDAAGLSEFFRAFRAECRRPGLIVDVRDNAGGYVSPLVLDCLRRRPIGYERPRHGRWQTWPPDAVRGPVVALCNQYAGSDGDLFCHAFRALGIGTLVGVRTWGGVVGFDVDGALADGTVVTQPEHACWLEGVGWGLENRGVEPDVEVELDPASAGAGLDPQLDRAIEVALELLAESPVEEPRF